MRTGYAPIAYFAFNRPGHAARSLEALAANSEAAETDLHIFIDGPRNDDDAKLVAEVGRIAESIHGFRSIKIVASDRNQGLYASITKGVGRIVADAGRVIVVEDDIVVSPFFLRYMNDGLDRYASDQRVGSIHAYSPPIPGLPEFFFLRGGDCWGWATWSDRWVLFQTDASTLLERLASTEQLDAFSSTHGTGSLLLLLRRARGKNQSWAILWHASLFLAERLTLHPGSSFADNIGNDGSGQHSANTSLYSTSLIGNYDGLPMNVPVAENPRASNVLSSFLDESAIGPGGSLRRRLIPVYAKLAARLHAMLS